jgi:hypothetical protein
MSKQSGILWLTLMAFLTLGSMASAQSNEAFVGRWSLTLPGNGVGWLGFEAEGGKLEGSMLWGGGTVKPLDRVSIKGDRVEFTSARLPGQTVEAVVSGDSMKLVLVKPNGNEVQRTAFSGQRMAPLPPAPDLSKAHYGDPVVLFNGLNLDGWQLQHPSHKNGWSAQDGVLVNHPEKGVRGYGNLLTERTFEDFNLKLDVLVPEKSNSGIFLRGMYEVQVLDSYGQRPGPHNMGAVFSRIVPSVAAEKPAGEWQHMDITLMDQHVTVVLNGTTIIDNQPLLGCTGGAQSSDPSRPGPILLQGNHGAVEYKNMVLTPIVNSLALENAGAPVAPKLRVAE